MTGNKQGKLALKNQPFSLQLFLCTLTGALMPLAFAPFAVWPLAIILPALILLLVDAEKTARRIFLKGWCFGLGYFGFGVYWIYNSLHDFGMAPPLVAAAMTALLVMFLSVFPALTLNAWQSIQRRTGQKPIWLLPVLWFAFEWLRGWLLTGMPWLSLGYALIESPLAGFAPLIGVYGLSALAVLIAVVLVHVIKTKAFSYLAIVILLPALGFGLQQVEWTEQQASSLDVTIVQGNIPQQIKWQYDQRHNIFNTYWRETEQYWDSDLIVWPETALPDQSENIRQSLLEPVAKIAAARGSHILSGIVVSDQANQKFYNSMLLLGANEAVYHKRHLVLFGEYYPLRWLLDFMSHLINIPHSDLEPGPEQQPLMQVNGLLLGISICFEDAFSRDIMLSIPAANLLVNASNDAWFGDSLAPHQHLQIARMRALETGRAMVRATNTGISAFIDFRGRIIVQSEQFKTQSLTQAITGRTGVTPFYYFAKLQPWIVLVILFALLMVRLKRGFKKKQGNITE